MREFGDEEYARILREYRGRTFGFASRNFYVAFLAARHVDQNIEKYFPGIKQEDPVDYETSVLTDYMPIGSVAAALGITERQLGAHNLALQATVFQGSKYLPKDFELRVPGDEISQPLDQLIAGVPADERFSKQLPDLFHKVARGDTLSEIADEYGTRVSTLVALNGLGSSHRIRIGQQIRLPAAGPAPEVVAANAAASQQEERPPEVVAAKAAASQEKEPTPEVVAANAAASQQEEPTPEVVAANAAASQQEEPPIVAEMTPVTEVDSRSPVADEDEEPVDIGALADEFATTVKSTLQSSLLSDPSDYTVASDKTIEVHPLETLGHYADWLGIKTQRLRDINGLAFRAPVEVGQRIKLDLGTVDAQAFETRRTEYHRYQQDMFFRENTIAGIFEHKVVSGESVWILSLRKYGVPIWLFRQYNPSLDLHNVHPGTKLSFPVLAKSAEAT